MAAYNAASILSASTYKLLPWYACLTGQRGAQDFNAVYVRSTVYGSTGEVAYASLRQLDTVKGRSVAVAPSGKVRRWLLDQHGEHRLAVTREPNIQATLPITQPLLLAYGAADQRVPLYHGKQFYAAVRQHNRDVEWVVYDEESHGWTLPKNRIDFWGRVEKFLDRNIGKDSAAAKKE